MTCDNSPKSRIIPAPPKPWKNWEELMALALVEAEKAASAGEVPVGAIVIDSQGSVIGAGYNQTITTCSPAAHAEILALQDAAQSLDNYRLNDCHLIVTMEPCLMCTGAIVHARVAGLVYGAYDTKGGTISSCLDGLEFPFHNSKVWHMGGILEKECSAMLNDFFAAKR